MPENKAYSYSIKLLSKRDYSIFKMSEKLKSRSFSESEITTVIEKLINQNYLREYEFTLSRAKQLLARGYADSYIIKKLETEHLQINQNAIDDLKVSQGIDTHQKIKELIEKKIKYKTIPDDDEEKIRFRNKIMSFLSSKGYPFDEIQTALSEYIK